MCIKKERPQFFFFLGGGGGGGGGAIMIEFCDKMSVNCSGAYSIK